MKLRFLKWVKARFVASFAGPSSSIANRSAWAGGRLTWTYLRIPRETPCLAEAMIGCVTIIIGDLASLLGCSMQVDVGSYGNNFLPRWQSDKPSLNHPLFYLHVFASYSMWGGCHKTSQNTSKKGALPLGLHLSSSKDSFEIEIEAHSTGNTWESASRNPQDIKPEEKHCKFFCNLSACILSNDAWAVGRSVVTHHYLQTSIA